jgi:putative aminopeptidase FrvX
MQNDIVDILMRLLGTRSVTGNTETAACLVGEHLSSLGLAVTRTNKGSLIATVDGTSRTGDALMVAAHLDTLGAMVSSVADDGTLRFRMVGGYTMNSVEGEYCTVETYDGRLVTGTILFSETSVHAWGREKASAPREPAKMLIRLDEDVSDADQVRELGISVGNFVHFDPRPVSTPSGFVKSRHLDDKAGVAVLVCLATRLASAPPPRRVYLNFTVHEEVGHGGAGFSPPDLTEILVVDMGVAGPGRESSEKKVTVCAADNLGPYNYDMTRALAELAGEKSIPFVVDTYPYYTSDAAASLRSGMDARHALIGPGVDSSHSMERTHREGLEATLELAAAYCYA